jgi:hypothetical protein
MADERTRRRYRFRLRTLLLIVLVVAIWLGWKVERARTQIRAIDAVRKAGGWVEFDYDYKDDVYTPGGKPRMPEWLVNAIGVEYFREIQRVNLVYDDKNGLRQDNANVQSCEEVLALLSRLPGLKHLFMKEGQATDEGMRLIGQMMSLETLFVWDATALTDTGIAHLKNLKRLKQVHFSEGKLTDRSLILLSELPWIKILTLQGNHFTDDGITRMGGADKIESMWLGLGGTRFSDAGVKTLVRFGRLKILDIQGSPVTIESIERLATLPNLKTIHMSIDQLSLNQVERLKMARPDLTIR